MSLKLSRFCFIVSIVLCVWGTSGTKTWPLFLMLLSGALSFVFALWAKGTSMLSIKALGENPFFLSGILLALMTLVQFLNADLRVYQHDGHKYAYTLDHFKNLPSGIVNDWGFYDTFTTLLVIVSCWYFAMTSWSLLKDKSFALRALKIFAINGFLMSLLAIAQKLAGAKKLYWLIHSELDFYGSFFYQNAAASFLVTVCASIAALAYINFKKSRFLGGSIYASMFALTSIAVLFSGSKGGILSYLAMLLILSSSILFAYMRRLCLTPYASAAATAILIAAACSIFALLGRDFIRQKISSEMDDPNSSIMPRLMINALSYKIFKESPICGVGGGSYGIRVQTDFPEAVKNRKDGSIDFINGAHNDPFQYLCEYGMLGFTFIAYGTIVWIANLFKLIKRGSFCLANFIFLSGIIACLLHSLVDMHMHIPSNICAFALLSTLAVCKLKYEKPA